MEQLIKAEYNKLMESYSSLKDLIAAVEKKYAGDHRYINTISFLRDTSAAINKALVILDQVGFYAQQKSLAGPTTGLQN